MAGPDFTSVGGGANYQCLPSDPEYKTRAPDAPHAAFTSVWFHNTVENTFSNSVSWKSLPCTVCEVPQRSSKIMIPAKTRCPSSDWTLEYNGFIMTAADRFSDTEPIKDKHYKGTYECIDEDAEGAPFKSPGSFIGTPIYTVKVDCNQFYQNCPPYKSGKALSCVVCSK